MKDPKTRKRKQSRKTIKKKSIYKESEKKDK